MTQLASDAAHLSLFNPELTQAHVPQADAETQEVDDSQMLRLELTARLAFDQEVVAAGGNSSPWYQYSKRALDILGASVLLVLFAPIMAVTYLALRISGQPIFKQERVGLCGRKFTMLQIPHHVHGC